MKNISIKDEIKYVPSRPSGDPKIRAKDIFTSIDVNQDGTLTQEEFVKGCSLIGWFF